MNLSKEKIEYFNTKYKVCDKTGCWLWSGSLWKDRGGYGRFFITSKKALKAHRVSYTIHKGPIPDGMFVCHHCDNTKCVNPDHLFAGYPKQNSADMVAKGRSARVYGEAHSQAKLTNDNVLEIRKLVQGGLEQNKVAEMFGVSRAIICNIVKRKRWTHI